MSKGGKEGGRERGREEEDILAIVPPNTPEGTLHRTTLASQVGREGGMGGRDGRSVK